MRPRPVADGPTSAEREVLDVGFRPTTGKPSSTGPSPPTRASAQMASTLFFTTFLPHMRSGILAGSGPALDPVVALGFPLRRPPRQRTPIIA